MQIGLKLPHFGPLASPAAIRGCADMAESLGFHSLGLSDHVVLPEQSGSHYDLGAAPAPVTGDELRTKLAPLYESLATAAYVLGMTKRVRVSTNVCVLPLRNPLYNAKQIATIDALSGGRLDLGVGAGWLREEAEALQMPWDERGARLDEHIAVLRTLWNASSAYVSFEGRFYRFDKVDPTPLPAQKPVPILIGGHSRAAKQRAARTGDGWMSHLLPVDVQRAGMTEVRAEAQKAGRDPEQLKWFGAVMAKIENGVVVVPQRLVDWVAGYRTLGLHNVNVGCSADTIADREKLIEWLAKNILPLGG